MKVKGRPGFNKIKHWSHTDLDGIGCAVITKALFGDKVDCEFIDANKSSEIINDWLNRGNYSVYNTVVISDISVSPEVADRLEATGLNLVLLDHHETAMNITNRPWCTVIDTVEWCGTNLTYEYFKRFDGCAEILAPYEHFVYEVHMYDNWLWIKDDCPHANQLNTLLRILGKERFLDRFVEDPSVEFSNSEMVMLMLEQEHIRNYVFSRNKSSFMSTMVVNGTTYDCAVTFADQYVNDVAHDLFDLYKDANVAIVVSFPYTMSMRTRDGSDIDLTNVTVPLGGGGHPASGGVPIEKEDLVRTIKNLITSRGQEIYA